MNDLELSRELQALMRLRRQSIGLRKQENDLRQQYHAAQAAISKFDREEELLCVGILAEIDFVAAIKEIGDKWRPMADHPEGLVAGPVVSLTEPFMSVPPTYFYQTHTRLGDDKTSDIVLTWEYRDDRDSGLYFQLYYTSSSDVLALLRKHGLTQLGEIVGKKLSAELEVRMSRLKKLQGELQL